MKIHFKVLEDFEKLKKSETMIKAIRDIESVQNENTDLKVGFYRYIHGKWYGDHIYGIWILIHTDRVIIITLS